MTESTFLPLIPAMTGQGSDSKSEARRMFRSAADSALHVPECAAAIRPYKANGEVHGHKVLDNAKAVEALADTAPAHLQSVLRMDALTLFEKTQCLDAVLRKYWTVDKRGKLDGTPAPKLLLKQQKASEPAETL